MYGDLYYDNVFDGGVCGWLVIDFKCLFGGCVFDYIVLFCNLDLCGLGIYVVIYLDIFDCCVD
ncbi:hypothetical protein G3565_34010 [Escherichia coli]|nr:hypothetical protein [Escherichia coli]